MFRSRIQVRIGDREVTNPIVKGFFALGALALLSVVFAIVVFVILPLVGVALGIAAGVVTVAALATVCAFPLLLARRRDPAPRIKSEGGK